MKTNEDLEILCIDEMKNFNFETKFMNFNFEAEKIKNNFEINENENIKKLNYSNLSITNLTNLSIISDTSLSDSNIDIPNLSVKTSNASFINLEEDSLSNLFSDSIIDIPRLSVTASNDSSKNLKEDSLSNLLDLSNISSNASFGIREEGCTNYESIECNESKSKSSKNSICKSIKTPNSSQSRNVFHQDSKNPKNSKDTPAREGQGIEGGATSPATEEAKGCSLLPDVNEHDQANGEGETASHATEEANGCSLLPDDTHTTRGENTLLDKTRECILLPDVIETNKNNEDNIDDVTNNNVNNNNNNSINVNNISNNENDITTNLYKNFREAFNNDKALIEPSDEKGIFTLATMNSCGLRSKHVTVANAGIRNNLDAIVISETHMAGWRGGSVPLLLITTWPSSKTVVDSPVHVREE